ncbi:winged helix-turn-helix transcriptional regulator [Crassaminicella thermophila]|uniref:Winged helix-turn-helix transcriptional regulator n=1 Tax=Crassaminicella thermophila TaxID=2599308 RepID=A0A5C0SH46_CRATE|nr:PfkB family carbohydrate kinase [Crassaminicella thermophila]QEK12997.1 winged helix-turn-helix transcriptional regulator [Crassaminicella thermophila]
MTDREKEILSLIQKNPFISQQELATTLGIARSSVAVHITNLMKKGYIKGKGYILREAEYVAVIGGTNIDIQGFPSKPLILNDSNPGKVKISLGGVGRNIAENLVKLGIETKLISAIGDDLYGRKILEECKLSGIDMQHCLTLKDMPSSTYLSILDENRDLKVAISHMDIFNKITIDFIRKKFPILKNSQLVVVDTNISEEILYYLVTNLKEVNFFLDPVSTSKSRKVKDFIGYFHTIKPNKLEAEILSNIKINTRKDLEKVSYYFLNQGVKKVFISLGKEGVFYADENNKNFLSTPKINVVNATGAGDAFMSGLIYSYLNDYSLDASAKFAIGASILALSHENTINPTMSLENIKKQLKEMNIC